MRFTEDIAVKNQCIIYIYMYIYLQIKGSCFFSKLYCLTYADDNLQTVLTVIIVNIGTCETVSPCDEENVLNYLF